MFVTDTHPLIWYAGEKYGKLSIKVREIFDDCFIRNRTAIYLPSAVLWEISLVCKSNPNELKIENFNDFVDNLLTTQTLIEEAVSSEIIKCSHYLSFHTDPFDTLIVATALAKDLPLITNDSVLHKTTPCSLVWD